MSKVTVLGGAGAMGQVIVLDLAESEKISQVTIADFDLARAEALKEKYSKGKIKAKLLAKQADIRNHASLVALLKGQSTVVNSSPYKFNIEVMKAALEAGCHYIDLGGLFHVTLKQLELNEEFKKKNLLAVLGMGAAPGITNIMAQSAETMLDSMDSIDIVDACVDFVESDSPLQPPYSLDTILDEYMKQPMVFEEGKLKAVPAISGEITCDFQAPLGRAKAIYTLHSEVATLPQSYQHKGVKRVTFRLALPLKIHEGFKFVVELGLGAEEQTEIDGAKIAPRKVLAHLVSKLSEKFPQASGDPDDFEIARVDVAGMKDGQPVLIRQEAITKSARGLSCGALNTGIPPSIVCQMIVADQIKERGCLPPEKCVPFKLFFAELEKRNIAITTETLLPAAR